MTSASIGKALQLSRESKSFTRILGCIAPCRKRRRDDSNLRTNAESQMLTPRFTASQTASRVQIRIEIPHLNANVDDADYLLIQHNTEDYEPLLGSASNSSGRPRIVDLDESGDDDDEGDAAEGSNGIQEWTEVRFSAGPYFLAIVFGKGCVLLDEVEAKVMGRKHRVKYDPETRAMTLELPKREKGKDFGDLEMLTKLKPSEIETRAPRMSVISEDSSMSDFLTSASLRAAPVASQGEAASSADASAVRREFLDIGGSPLKPTPTELLGSIRYGFDHRHSEYFADLQHPELLGEVFDNPEPQRLSFAERRLRREQSEFDDFNPDAVELDFAFDEGLQYALDFRSPLLAPAAVAPPTIPASTVQTRDLDPASLIDNLLGLNARQIDPPRVNESPKAPPAASPFTEAERDLLRALPNRPIIPPSGVELANVCGDNSCESPWTVVKLSPALSWLDTDWCLTANPSGGLDATLSRNIPRLLRALAERMLCYPLFRNWKLVMACVEDAMLALVAGRRTLLRIMLDLKGILDHSETRFHLSRLFIDDYCLFLQSEACRNEDMEITARVLQNWVSSSARAKADLRWDLAEREAEAVRKRDEGYGDDYAEDYSD